MTNLNYKTLKLRKNYWQFHFETLRNKKIKNYKFIQTD